VRQSRRDLIGRGAAIATGLLTYAFDGGRIALTPAEAHAAGMPYRTLDEPAVRCVNALGEALLPGSTAAGLAEYLDHQLSGPPADSMLMIKYLRVPAPFTDFYLSGLRAADASARMQHGKAVAELDPAAAAHLAGQMSAGQIPGWTGPPAAAFFFVLRSDAIDVAYGTQTGFQKLGVPYMAHIAPPTRWG